MRSARPVKPPIDPRSEGEIQREIVKALRKCGHMVLRVNSGKVKVRGGFMQLAPDGTADLLIFVEPWGRVVGLEIKDAKGTQRESQVAWAAQLRAKGGHYAIVRNLDDALAAVKDARDTSMAAIREAADRSGFGG